MCAKCWRLAEPAGRGNSCACREEAIATVTATLGGHSTGWAGKKELCCRTEQASSVWRKEL